MIHNSPSTKTSPTVLDTPSSQKESPGMTVNAPSMVEDTLTKLTPPGVIPPERNLVVPVPMPPLEFKRIPTTEEFMLVSCLKSTLILTLILIGLLLELVNLYSVLLSVMLPVSYMPEGNCNALLCNKGLKVVESVFKVLGWVLLSPEEATCVWLWFSPVLSGKY